MEKVEDIEKQPRIMGVWLSYFNPLFNDSHALRLRVNLGCKENERRAWFNKPDDYEKKKKANIQKAIRKNKRAKKKKEEQAKQDEEKTEVEDKSAEENEQMSAPDEDERVKIDIAIFEQLEQELEEYIEGDEGDSGWSESEGDEGDSDEYL